MRNEEEDLDGRTCIDALTNLESSYLHHVQIASSPRYPYSMTVTAAQTAISSPEDPWIPSRLHI